jgi:hypothetical protein
MSRYYFPIIDLLARSPNNSCTSEVDRYRVKRSFKSVINGIVTTLCVIAVLWLLASISIYRVMKRPPEAFSRVMAKIPQPAAFIVLPFETLWLRARTGTLRVGDHAPDFTLKTLDKSSTVQLSSLTAQGKPVVLVFGSYT